MAGIVGAGNWIVDNIKFIDAWPQQGELVNILEENNGGGGSPFNVLTDIARAGFSIPVYGAGCIGEDETGAFIRDHCRVTGINDDYIVTLKDYPTSYTDVMTIKSTGDRTFFHARGANAVFSPGHVPVETFAEKGVSLFHLGYILLLDAMDAEDPEYGTAAARLLSAVQDAGIETSIDVVSESSDRFRRLVVPALKYTDHCILNEIEAQKTTGETIRGDGGVDKDALVRAADKMFAAGVSRTVVIHFPEGAFWKDNSGHQEFRPSYDLDGAGIVSAVGAGDAFCAGVLTGIHEGWKAEDCLQAGTDLACACLFAPDTTGGITEFSGLRKKHAGLYRLRDS